jgi:hypothetical protein
MKNLNDRSVLRKQHQITVKANTVSNIYVQFS